jgi:hypothetical protein
MYPMYKAMEEHIKDKTPIACADDILAIWLERKQKQFHDEFYAAYVIDPINFKCSAGSWRTPCSELEPEECEKALKVRRVWGTACYGTGLDPHERRLSGLCPDSFGSPDVLSISVILANGWHALFELHSYRCNMLLCLFVCMSVGAAAAGRVHDRRAETSHEG